MRLVKFTGRKGTYTFPPQTDGRDNFGDLVPATSRLAGVNGGFDEYGEREAPQSIGDVRASWYVIPDALDPENSTISILKQNVRAMLGWGKQFLFIQPEDRRYGKRWVDARLNNLNMSENVHDVPHLRQKVSASFQASTPAWQGDFAPWNLDEGISLDSGYHIDGTWYLDDGILLDDGYALPGAKLEGAATNGSSFTVTNYGNHAARPLIFVGARSEGWVIGDGTILGGPPEHDFGAGGSVNSITMKRTSGGALQDEFTWSGYLEPGEELVIDCAALAVRHSSNEGDVSGYAQFTPTTGFGFMDIPPGDSTIELYGGFGADGGGDCYIAMYFQDTWY